MKIVSDKEYADAIIDDYRKGKKNYTMCIHCLAFVKDTEKWRQYFKNAINGVNELPIEENHNIQLNLFGEVDE